MQTLHLNIEQLFSSLGKWVYRNKFISLGLSIVITLLCLAKVTHLTVDISNDAFYSKDDPIRVEYDKFRREFGKDDHILIAVKTEQLFNYEFLHGLKALHQELEQKTPHLQKVTSLINARHTQVFEDELLVEGLMDEIPSSIDALETLQAKIKQTPYYQNYLISSDGHYVFLDLEPNAITTNANQSHFVSTEEYAQMVDAINPILQKYHSLGFDTYLSGFPVVTDKLTSEVEETTAELAPFSMLFNILILTLLFRRFSGVYYPCVIVSFTIASTIGLMAWQDIPLDLVTTILPTMLSVVAIADSIHVLTSFYQVFEKNGGLKEEAIAIAISKNGLAILMTTLTTALGLTSLIYADVEPISNLGYIAPIGIVLAFIYTVLLLPSLIAIFPMKKTQQALVTYDFTDKLLENTANFSIKYAKPILVLSLTVFVVGLCGSFQLKISHSGLNWLPDNAKVKQDTLVIDEAIGGSIPVEILIDTKREGGVYDHQLLRKIEKSIVEISQIKTQDISVGNILSLTTLLKEVHQTLNSDRGEYYIIPDDNQLIAQELFLFELASAEELRKFVNADYSKLRLTVMLPFADAMQIKPVLDQLNQYFDAHYPNLDITITGIGPMFVETMHDVITSMFKSYGFALVVITLLMILFIGKLKLGLISMVPNLVPIVLVVGMMGWFGLPFDFANMMVGSVALGLVVDDTIHFLHCFNRYYAQTKNTTLAIKESIQTTGKAIFITSMVLISGMMVAMTADLKSTSNFGLITACAICFALLADFFFVPAILCLLNRDKEAILTEKDARLVVSEA